MDGWFKRLTDQGKAIAGNPLEPEGKIVSGKNRVVSDGPFAESKKRSAAIFCWTSRASMTRWRSRGLSYRTACRSKCGRRANVRWLSELEQDAQFANASRGPKRHAFGVKPYGGFKTIVEA